MTPGLAVFYGGMVRTRNTLAMLQQNMIALGVVSLTWIFSATPSRSATTPAAACSATWNCSG